MPPEKEVDPNVSSGTDEPSSPDNPKTGEQAAAADHAADLSGGVGLDESAARESIDPVGDAPEATEPLVGSASDENVVSIDGEVVQAEDAASPEDLLTRLTAAESRADENWDKFIRLQAEMENQRKRAQKEVGNARKFALEGMVEALLPIRDSLELGLQAADSEDANVASIREGSELTLKMLAQAFEKFNIEEVNPLDEKFNPEFHQAMSMQAVEGKAANTVTAVLQKGYTLNERLIRPALVMVAK